MTEIHDLSAVELLQRYRAKTLSPTEVFAAVEKHIARWEPHIKALYAYDPESARARSRRLDAALGEGRAGRTARRRAGDREGEHRLEGRAGPARHRRDAARPRRAGCAAACARLREAGAIIFSKTTMPDYGMTSSGVSSFHPLTRNAVGPVEESRRIELRRGRGRCGRLRPAACRHRHRRLGAPARRLVRPGRAQAEPRAHSDRSALRGALRRADDAHGRRHRADDVGAVASRITATA